MYLLLLVTLIWIEYYRSASPPPSACKGSPKQAIVQCTSCRHYFDLAWSVCHLLSYSPLLLFATAAAGVRLFLTSIYTPFYVLHLPTGFQFGNIFHHVSRRDVRKGPVRAFTKRGRVRAGVWCVLFPFLFWGRGVSGLLSYYHCCAYNSYHWK